MSLQTDGVKPKKCRVCRRPFEPRNSLQACCSGSCAITYARLGGEKRQSAAMKRVALAQDREDRERLKTLGDLLKEAQRHFNRYIRLRDAHQPCISCGRNTGSKRNAGHYLSVGARGHLRFNEDNVHSQCEHCNSWKSGNQAEYRVRLIDKIGLEKVEALENDNNTIKWDRDSIVAIRKKYAAKCREYEKPR